MNQQETIKPISADINDAIQAIGIDGINQQFAKHEKVRKSQNADKKSLESVAVSLSMLDKLLKQITDIDFKKAVTEEVTKQNKHLENTPEKLQEKLAVYNTQGGGAKIPPRICVVIIIDRLLAIASQNNIDICRHYDEKVNVAYIFNGKYWEVIEGGTLRAFLTKCAIKSGYMVLESKTPTFHELINKTFWYNSDFQKISKDNSDTTLINLNNCTLEITSNSVTPVAHKKEHFLLYKLDFDYNEDATATKFQQYLNRVLPDLQSQQLLQEVIGYVFTKHLKLEKCAVLYGGGSNGKSVFFDIIMALLGANNVTNFSLKHLSEEHNRAMLDGKLLNYGSEINSGIDNDIFKQLASGEPVQARHKYGHPFTIYNYARLIFNANELPRATELTNAYFRRFLLVHFDEIIDAKDADPELANKIIQSELAGVMNWVITGVKRLQTNKKFSDCDKSKLLLDNYRKESDVVALFIEDSNYQVSDSQKQLLKDIYSEFKTFCTNSGYQQLSDKSFSKRLRELGYDVRRQKARKSYVWIIKHDNYIE